MRTAIMKMATMRMATKRKATKRKATIEIDSPQKRQRVENGADANDSSGQSTVLLGQTSRADFETNYVESEMLGKGGFGSVHAGHRSSDYLPVAIKHISKRAVRYHKVVVNGKTCRIPKEVRLMHKVTGEPESMGKSAAVSLLEWYDLDKEVILVMERPLPSMDMRQLRKKHPGPMAEKDTKLILKQLIDAAIDMQDKGVFHRDIKAENILIEFSSDGPRVRLIDFGCGYLWMKDDFYRRYAGTSAYAPPEYKFQGRYKAGPATVWQVAALLFEMLDGVRRFNTNRFIRQNLTINSQWPKECQDFLKKCLALNPEDRATLEEMQQWSWLTAAARGNQ